MNRYLCVCLFAALSILALVKGQASNCVTGSKCDACEAGRFWTVRIGSRQVKVCSPKCLKSCRAGNQPDGRPFCTCYDPADITGDCWKGDQCNTCLASPNKGYVGNINGISVCCANCERSGLALSSRSCSCLHNGP
ncbi:uncharacterized protein LOC127844969 [Dreissena polymorpha]|uniref:Uncharacterized protein n=1 Tax=Dreissena polymorpha TaxID=45954 RepID=A0A9D4E2N6_DREPO|nr:uncharacterized protein LOC127844969 [Dreissena polymorpha]KAH3772674.1 hypothetical protein DPMN_174016 [Dreissena polymorpha]